jgi:hypothetical protein
MSTECPKPQRVDHFEDFSSELRKRENHRVAFSDIGLIENYLRKELCVLIDFRVQELELLALFQYSKFPEVCPSISIPLIGDEGITIYSSDVSEASEQHIVLVDGVKAMESPERVIPSLVWVDIPDRIYSFLPHAMYFCRKTGFELRGRNRSVENWEFDLIRDFLPVSDNKGACEMIEGASQVVNGIPDDAKQLWRDRISLKDMDSWLRGVCIHIYVDGIRISASEGAQLHPEISDMFFGPVDFLANS